MDFDALIDGFLELDRGLERMARIAHVDETNLPARAAYRLGLLQQSIRLARRAINEADYAVGGMASEDFNASATADSRPLAASTPNTSTSQAIAFGDEGGK